VADVTVDHAAVGRFFDNPDGPLARWLAVKGQQVAAAAQDACPRRSGRLAGSIRVRLEDRPLAAVVYSDLTYARVVHSRNRPFLLNGLRAVFP